MFDVKPGVLTGSEAARVLDICKEKGFALPAINIVGTNSANAVMEAAKEVNLPIIIQLSNGGAHFYAGDGKPIIIESARLGSPILNYQNSSKNMINNILCIVAHPDDEALGLGGTLIKHSKEGDIVNIIILSEGEESKSIGNKKNPKRRNNALEWSQKTGCNLHKLFDFPDQKLDTMPQLDLVRSIEEEVIKIKPDIVYIHHPGDMNSDHQIAAQVSLASLRPMSYHRVIPEIRAFETPSSTDQAPSIEPYIFKPPFEETL